MTQSLTILFYALCYVFIIFEGFQIIWAKKIRERVEAIERHYRLIEIYGDEPDFVYDKLLFSIATIDACYFAWAMIGIFSSQWIFFACLILMTIVTPKNHTIKIGVVNNVISIILLFMILASKYHWA